MMDTRAISRALTERLESLDAELAELTAVPRDRVTAGSFGKRIGDGTTEAIDRMTKVGTAEQLAVMRTDVVRALEKIEEGTYGLCDRCGAAIPDARRPWRGVDPRRPARRPAVVGALRVVRFAPGVVVRCGGGSPTRSRIEPGRRRGTRASHLPSSSS